MKLSMVDVARITGGAVLGDGGAVVSGASIDSRTIREGELFVAITTGMRDGHGFITDAVRNGAAGLLLDREVEGVSAPRVIVGDTAAGLTAVARYTRGHVDPIVVGVTGSVGKTGTKDLIAAVASRGLTTVASEGNLNNELGVPLTLARAKIETEVVVCEMGARGVGQIAELCRLARPQVGVVTNVGVSHFEMFGSQENIARAKGELIASLDEGNTAVLNADDPLVAAMADLTEANVHTFGIDKPAWIRAEAIRFDRLGRPTFRMVNLDEAVWVTMGQSGRHQIYNGLAAAAVGLALGIEIAECGRGLEEASVSRWRMEVSEAAGVVFVNDAYNASPSSTAAALQAAADMVPAGGRLVAVLGYMAELGSIEKQEHHRIGALAASLASRLLVVGDAAAPIADGAVEAGMQDVVRIGSRAEVSEALELRPGDVLLVKGSRVSGLEGVVDEVKAMVAAS